MKYVDTYYVLKLYLDRLVFPRLSFSSSGGNDDASGQSPKSYKKVMIQMERWIWMLLYTEEENNLMMNLM